MCRDHHEHCESFQNIDWIHDEKDHPFPWWFVLSSATLLPSLQHKLVRVVVVPWVPGNPTCLMSYLGVLPSFMSRRLWEFHHLLRILDIVIHLAVYIQFLVPMLILTEVPTNERWCVKFKTSSNPIACKLMNDSSFLVYWLSNHHSNIDHAT